MEKRKDYRQEDFEVDWITLKNLSWRPWRHGGFLVSHRRAAESLRRELNGGMGRGWTCPAPTGDDPTMNIGTPFLGVLGAPFASLRLSSNSPQRHRVHRGLFKSFILPKTVIAVPSVSLCLRGLRLPPAITNSQYTFLAILAHPLRLCGCLRTRHRVAEYTEDYSILSFP